MEQELKFINFQGDKLTVLEGRALEDKYPVQIRLSGNIQSIGNFLLKRYEDGAAGKDLQFVDKEKAVVTVDDSALSILLQLDPQNHFGTEVRAQLQLTPEIQKFCINENKQFTREELIKLIRFNKRFFNSIDAHEVLLKAYQTLEIKTAGDLKQNSDSRGNKLQHFEKVVVSDSIPQTFVLNMPIFKGQPKEVFRVEICLEATDASVRFWFESVELAELIELRRDEIFATELEYCKDFVIIHK